MHTEESSDMSFLQELDDRGITVDEKIFQEFDAVKVQAYYEFLRDNNQRGGFFSRGDTDRILERHLLESLVFCYYVARALNVSRETKVADAGSGPGLPGYLFACLKEAPGLTLIDSSRRRLGLLEEFAGGDSPGGSLVFRYERLEEIREQFDLILIRALIPFPFCLELVSRLNTRNGHVAYFGSGPDSAASDAEWESEYLAKLGYVSRETIQPPEIQFLGRRSINILLKSGSTKNGYPRPWKKIRDDMRTRIA